MWVGAAQFEETLARSVDLHKSVDMAATLHFPKGCKLMVDAAVRVLSLVNQLQFIGKTVSLDFEDGQGSMSESRWRSLPECRSLREVVPNLLAGELSVPNNKAVDETNAREGRAVGPLARQSAAAVDDSIAFIG